MIDKWLDRPSLFRYGFLTIFLLSIAVNYFSSLYHTSFSVLYIISLIFLGIGFYNKSALFLIGMTVMVVLSRVYLVYASNKGLIVFTNYLLIFCLITFISASLMRYAQKVKINYIELVSSLANALDSRDPYTGHHSENVSMYSVQIAEKMNLKLELCESIRVGGLLHDIGKIGIPENVLTNPGKLTNEEYNLIKTHPKLGYDMIKHVSNFSESGVLDIILYHHERYDGTGYPKGLKGNEIPLVARIVSVADTFDAMISKRVYRDHFDLDYTLEEIRINKGKQFDPEIVDVFLSLFQKNKEE